MRNTATDALVVEEQLGDVAEVLAVDTLHRAVDLPHAHALVAVDLVAWRMPQRALL